MEQDKTKPELTPENSWPGMEQLLARHFAARRRRRVVLYLLLAVVSLSALLIGVHQYHQQAADAA